jgi:hypothetical protein
MMRNVKEHIQNWLLLEFFPSAMCRLENEAEKQGLNSGVAAGEAALEITRHQDRLLMSPTQKEDDLLCIDKTASAAERINQRQREEMRRDSSRVCWALPFESLLLHATTIEVDSWADAHVTGTPHWTAGGAPKGRSFSGSHRTT